MENVAIHENKNSTTVVKFINLDNFTHEFKMAYEAGLIYGVYLNESGEIEAHDIFGNILVDIIF